MTKRVDLEHRKRLGRQDDLTPDDPPGKNAPVAEPSSLDARKPAEAP